MKFGLKRRAAKISSTRRCVDYNRRTCDRRRRNGLPARPDRAEVWHSSFYDRRSSILAGQPTGTTPKTTHPHMSIYLAVYSSMVPIAVPIGRPMKVVYAEWTVYRDAQNRNKIQIV